MDREERESRRDSFLGDSGDYEAARPGYPSELLQTAVDLAGWTEGAPILEVGCGTGLATEWLAWRGFRVLATDRSAEMVDVATTRLARFPNVDVVLRDFERESTSETFAGLLFATSYHWLDPDTRVQRCARALAPGGALVLLWHVHPPPFTGYFDRCQEIYRRLMPGWKPPPSPGMTEVKLAPILKELADSPLFMGPERRSVDWSRTYDTALYMRLLNTYSDHRLLEAAPRQELLAALRALIDGEFGGEIEHPYRTELVVARRAG